MQPEEIAGEVVDRGAGNRDQRPENWPHDSDKGVLGDCRIAPLVKDHSTDQRNETHAHVRQTITPRGNRVPTLVNENGEHQPRRDRPAPAHGIGVEPDGEGHREQSARHGLADAIRIPRVLEGV